MSSTQYLISDGLWAKIEPLLPIHKTNHPLGTHRKRVDNRDAMNGILFVLSPVLIAKNKLLDSVGIACRARIEDLLKPSHDKGYHWHCAGIQKCDKYQDILARFWLVKAYDTSPAFIWTLKCCEILLLIPVLHLKLG